DEAQDTSKIQHNIIALLAGRYENLFMVGDEDQSIYGFRAAYPEALLSFEKNHPDAQILLMEENFRSNANIVTAADRFIQKNEFRHKKNMRPTRKPGTQIKEIEIKNRKAQYSYLAKMAADCDAQTAVLYRDNESILPVVDLLERQGIPYRMKNADLTFFSHRVVMDISDIIRFALTPWSTELFLKIYYKIGMYLNKNAAMEACRCSMESDCDVLDAALTYVELPAGTQKSVKAMQTHLSNLINERADKALYRIVNFMGYGDYLERMHVKDTKIPILEAIAANEPHVERLLLRLEELAATIREKEYVRDCNLIFSTIHSSKGLEYDTVYLLDAMDGVFPETVIKDRKRASQDDLKLYEEERRLFYVGVTRAKNQLVLFKKEMGTTFIDELMGRESLKPAYPVKTTTPISKQVQTGYGEASGRKSKKRIVTESEYLDKLEEIQTTGYVKHKTYGEGRVESIAGDILLVEFPQKTVKCKLKFMLEQGLIE
nr:ATP-dependent helicase [Acetatifactor sp.]